MVKKRNKDAQESAVEFLGLVVKAKREKRKLSQEAFAQLTGLHRTYISDVEVGRRNLSVQTLCRLADALGIKAWYLLRQAEVARGKKAKLDSKNAERKSRVKKKSL